MITKPCFFTLSGGLRQVFHKLKGDYKARVAAEPCSPHVGPQPAGICLDSWSFRWVWDTQRPVPLLPRRCDSVYPLSSVPHSFPCSSVPLHVYNFCRASFLRACSSTRPSCFCDAIPCHRTWTEMWMFTKLVLQKQ